MIVQVRKARLSKRRLTKRLLQSPNSAPADVREDQRNGFQVLRYVDEAAVCLLNALAGPK